jgi:hypothetical protein
MKNYLNKLFTKEKPQFYTVGDILDNPEEHPFLNGLTVSIPNQLGINLVSVKGFEVHYKYGNQIDNINIVFRPNSFQYTDTVEDWKIRVINEYNELSGRYNKLSKYIKAQTNKLTDEYKLLASQQKAMRMYKTILEKRIGSIKVG